MNWLVFLGIAAILLGYLIARLVPEEIQLGKAWLVAATILAAVPFFWLLPTWQGALAFAGTLIGGFLPVLVVALTVSSSSIGVATVSLLLGLLVGTRARVEGRSSLYLAVVSVIAIAAAVLPQII